MFERTSRGSSKEWTSKLIIIRITAAQSSQVYLSGGTKCIPQSSDR